ncbi:DUF3139 domain-containing protein [Terribacillus sp. AE2B 122]|jgi:Protein of unknown function (DUF3139)|uniref:DUF3139 domain-containing protein n=1 Tax=Terribacillus sp. AE2B 122 TaxID=1331902 RepID=UPI00158156B6|nr:DUF3139 domain-containing protein [Terribacillus sp. AE2B 122]
MKKKLMIIILLIIVIVGVVSFGNYFIDRYTAEKKIDSYIEDYGISKEDISDENYPLFGSLNSPPGFVKIIYTKDDGENFYIFEYDEDNDRVDVFANVRGNEVSMDDEFFKELKHQPSDKVLP